MCLSSELICLPGYHLSVWWISPTNKKVMDLSHIPTVTRTISCIWISVSGTSVPCPTGAGVCQAKAPLVPELHACAPGADVLPQKKVVESHRVDHVEELFEHLQDDLGVQALVAHDCVEGIHLADDGFQAVGVISIRQAGGTLPVARGLHPRQTLNALVLQHGRHWKKSMIREAACSQGRSVFGSLRSHSTQGFGSDPTQRWTRSTCIWHGISNLLISTQNRTST